jgi:LPXTG-motif cell wall-anchored protein
MISRTLVKWKSHNVVWTALSVAVVCLTLISPASAQLTEHKTVITFNAPVEVPGSTPQVLPAGTYTFKVVDSKVNRNIVQVSNKDETHVYTSILAIPTHRDTETSTTIMTFEERAAGQPQALRAWFYPYERNGQEFVYSKAQATELAKASNSAVPFTESANYQAEPVSTTSQAAAQSTPPVAIQSMLPTGQIASQTTQAPTTQIALATPPAPVQAQTRQETPAPTPVQTASLPQTGSTLPLLALIGCVSIFAGLSLRKWRVR